MQLVEEATQLAGVNTEDEVLCQVEHSSTYRKGGQQYDTPYSTIAVASILVTCQAASLLSCKAFVEWLARTDGCLYCRRSVAKCWSITLL